MVSLDWCLSFLHRMASHSTYRSSSDLTVNYASHSQMSHSVFLGRVLPPHAITGAITQSMSVCCSAVGWSAGYWKVNWLLAVSQQKHMASWLTFGIGCQAANHWLLVHDPVAIQVAEVQMSLTKCSTTMDPPMGVKFCHGVFLSYSLREARALGPGGYKSLRLHWDC